MSLASLMVAKEKRDATRSALIHELKQIVGLPHEVQALLIADELATLEFNNAVRQMEDV